MGGGQGVSRAGVSSGEVAQGFWGGGGREGGAEAAVSAKVGKVRGTLNKGVEQKRGASKRTRRRILLGQGGRKAGKRGWRRGGGE